MLFSKTEKRQPVDNWTAELWESVVGGHRQGAHQNVGLLIDGYAFKSDTNQVEQEFFGRVSAEAGSRAGHVPVSLSWITDGHDEVRDGLSHWQWGTARIPRGGRDVYGYIFPLERPGDPTLRVVLGTSPEGLQLFETLIVRAKQVGVRHVPLHLWLQPLENGSPSDKSFNRLMTVSRFVFDQRITL